MEKLIKKWHESHRSDDAAEKAQLRTEEFVAVEVTRASLSKVVAEQLLAPIAHKKWNPKLLAYCKLYYEAPAPQAQDGAPSNATQVYTACTKKVEGIDLDFQWQWNFRSRIVLRKASNPRLELHLCPHPSFDIPTRCVDVDIGKALKDKSEGEVQLMMEHSSQDAPGGGSVNIGAGGREGTITLFLTKGGTSASDSFVDVQQEHSCGVLRVVVYQAKALATRYPSYVAISLPHEPKKREHRTNECATPKAPVWDSTVEFDVVNLNGDLRLDVWESHTIRSDAPIGQVIIPLAWLVGGNPLVSYFEIFPVNSESNINRGGQYMKGADLPSRGDKTLGYLRVSAQLKLHASPEMLYTRNSDWLFKAAELNKVRTAQPASLILLKHNMERMHRKWKSIYFVDVVKDILNWKRDTSLSVLGLVLHCYLCLLAPVWHVPIALCFAIYVVGGECARTREFTYVVDHSDLDVDDDVPVSAKAPAGDRRSTGSSKDKVESEGKSSGKSDKSKTIQDRIRETRTTATRLQKKMNKGISVLEKVLNLLMMADPALSRIFYLALLGFSIFLSVVLYWIPIRIVFLLVGFLAFIPRERYKQAMEWLRETTERTPKRVPQESRRDSATGSALARAGAPVDGSPAVEKRHGHVCSGFLYAVEWTGEPIGDDDLPEDDIDDPWTRRWCTLWSTPPTLQASTRDGELNIALPGLAIAEFKELDFSVLDSKKKSKGSKDSKSAGSVKVDPQMLETLQAFGISTGADAFTTRDSLTDAGDGVVDDADESRSQPSINKRRSSQTASTRDFRFLYTFRLIDRANDRCWIFGAVKREEMESWMQSLASCGAVRLSPLELTVVTTYNKPYMYRVVKSLFELVPDDVDLEHRYICSLAQRSAQQVEERAPTRRFMPDDGTGKGAAATPDSEHVDGTQIRVSLLTAKGLPFKEQTFKLVGPLGNAIAKIYTILFLVPSSVSRDRYRSMSQARSPEPIWREDFRFTNVSLVPGTELQVVLVNKDPLSFSKQKDEATTAFLRNHKHIAELVDSLSDNESFIGFARVPITDQYGQQAWYPIEPIYSQNNQAAVLLEVSVV